jgi:ABC-type spermidine/putrescine transport system permease subunit I
VTRGGPSGAALGRLAVVPDFLWVAAFFVAPAALILAFSFGHTDVVTLQTKFGFDFANYKRVFDSFILDAVARSLLISLGATAGCLVLALPMAIWMARQPERVRRILVVAVIAPFWISFIARVVAWDTLLSVGGPIDDLFKVFGSSFNLYGTAAGTAIVIIYQYLPLMIFPIYVAVERVDPNLLAAASDLGARNWRVFWRVILPLARPGIAAGVGVVGILALGEYVIPDLVGGGKTVMIGTLIADQFNSGEVAFGSALTMSLIALLFLIVLTQQLLGRQRGRRA